MFLMKKIVPLIIIASPLFAKEIKHPTCHLHLERDLSYPDNIKYFFQKRGYMPIDTDRSDRNSLEKGELLIALRIEVLPTLIRKATVSLSLQKIIEPGRNWKLHQCTAKDPVVIDLRSQTATQYSIGESIGFGRALKKIILDLPTCVVSN